jgi:hypothetical protein
MPPPQGLLKFKPPVKKRQLVNDKTNWSGGTWADTAFDGLHQRMDPAGSERDRTAQWHAQKEQEQGLQSDVGLMMAPQDIAGGAGQYIAGEAMGAMGVDPISMLTRGAEAIGVNPAYGLAVGGGLLGVGKLKKAGKAMAAEARAGKRAATKPKATAPKNVSPSKMSDAELTALGESVGVNMKPSPMLPVVDPATGKEYLIPGGLKTPFSYTDLHQLKARAYNPNDMSPAFQARIQKRMLEATTPKQLDKYEILNRTMFGMHSPNTPLSDNMFMTTAMRARNEGDIEKLAGYTKGKNLDLPGRRQADEQMAADYRIGAGHKGGLGVRSSVDQTNVSELAAKVQENPQAFMKQPQHNWLQHVERIANQLRGLSAKTSSFSSVWQNPGEADISAIDRHMARKGLSGLLEDPELGPKFRQDTLNAYNAQVDKLLADGIKAKHLKKFEQVPEDFVLSTIEATVNNPGMSGKWEMKGGLLNPRTPEHLQDLPYRGGEKFETVGPVYKKMLADNKTSGEANGLNLFGEQWRIWDRIRNSLEPHEVMYPGLHKLPALSFEDLKKARAVNSAAGFSGTGTRRPYDWKEGLYWALPVGGLLGASAAPSGTPQERKAPEY